ncbi:ANTAR domain-containing protein [Paenibacillus sp. HB172176]|uniref:ANTAR domain-containing response regulator n=1 Tax=Paenibacillus sp. HB172176 TaxID=2493690 RepID=UPI00143BB2D6|nr:ANTAR domain-containing protein [Paenibacillus sp. HB172176]
MRFLLLIERGIATNESQGRTSQAADKTLSPKHVLQSHGYEVKLLKYNDPPEKSMDGVDAIVMNLPLSEAEGWRKKLVGHKPMPLLWWCSERTAIASNAFCEDDICVDGILTRDMSNQAVEWALHIGAKQSMERQQWHIEKKQLESRLEERKWIDMAKGILCKIKNVSEAEAYEMLRKQAMNERKRMVDVATSIVKVYQLLQDQK